MKDLNININDNFEIKNFTNEMTGKIFYCIQEDYVHVPVVSFSKRIFIKSNSNSTYSYILYSFAKRFDYNFYKNKENNDIIIDCINNKNKKIFFDKKQALEYFYMKALDLCKSKDEYKDLFLGEQDLDLRNKVFSVYIEYKINKVKKEYEDTISNLKSSLEDTFSNLKSSLVELENPICLEPLGTRKFPFILK